MLIFCCKQDLFASYWKNCGACIYTSSIAFGWSIKYVSRCLSGWDIFSGAITFDELYDIAKDMKSTSKSQLLSAFHKIDINGDGYITEKELYEVLTSVSSYVCDRSFTRVVLNLFWPLDHL